MFSLYAHYPEPQIERVEEELSTALQAVVDPVPETFEHANAFQEVAEAESDLPADCDAPEWERQPACSGECSIRTLPPPPQGDGYVPSVANSRQPRASARSRRANLCRLGCGCHASARDLAFDWSHRFSVSDPTPSLNPNSANPDHSKGGVTTGLSGHRSTHNPGQSSPRELSQPKQDSFPEGLLISNARVEPEAESKSRGQGVTSVTPGPTDEGGLAEGKKKKKKNKTARKIARETRIAVQDSAVSDGGAFFDYEALDLAEHSYLIGVDCRSRQKYEYFHRFPPGAISESTLRERIQASSLGLEGWAKCILRDWTSGRYLLWPGDVLDSSVDPAQAGSKEGSPPFAEDGRWASAAESVEESKRRAAKPKPCEDAILAHSQELEDRQRQVDQQRRLEEEGRGVIGVYIRSGSWKRGRLLSGKR